MRREVRHECVVNCVKCVAKCVKSVAKSVECVVNCVNVSRIVSMRREMCKCARNVQLMCKCARNVYMRNEMCS